MLITFRFENFMSFNAESELSLLAGQTRSFPEQVVKGKTRNDADVLKASILYGANASGKSNIIKALDFAKETITQGLKNRATLNKWFRLDTANSLKSSRFEFEFKQNSKVYAYGFEVILATKTFVSEWLFEIGKTTEKAIFERKIDAQGESIFEGGFKPKGEAGTRYGLFQKDVLKNQLFLYEINDRKTANLKGFEAFHEAFQWFKEKLVIIYPNSTFTDSDLVGKNPMTQKTFSYFLNFFKTGIDAIETIELDFEEATSKFSDDLKSQILNDLAESETNGLQIKVGNQRFFFFKDVNGTIKTHRLMTKHTSKDGKSDILFEVSDESDGTQRVFDLLPALMQATRKDIVLVIDELDRSMHPELTQKLLDVFFKNTAHNESQIILTTHESNLLDLDFLRRDEVWFVEKNSFGESKIYSLEEYTPRHDKEIRKAYLLGRFGAIPYIGHVQQNQMSLAQ
jgi:uncharacterized protein